MPIIRNATTERNNARDKELVQTNLLQVVDLISAVRDPSHEG